MGYLTLVIVGTSRGWSWGEQVCTYRYLRKLDGYSFELRPPCNAYIIIMYSHVIICITENFMITI